MKRCPFCAEEIQDAAVKCRFCGEMFDRDTVNIQARPAAPLPPQPPPRVPIEQQSTGAKLRLTAAGSVIRACCKLGAAP